MRSGLLSLLVAAATAAALFALAGYQVTGETAAVRLLGRLAAALVEVDRWLPAHREDIDLLARGEPDRTVVLNDLPVPVALPAADVIDADETALRDRIVGSMGEALYRDGSGAFRAEAGGARLSVAEPTRWTATLLSRGAHAFWLAALVLTLLTALALAAVFLQGGRSPLLPLTAGAVFAAACSLAVWLLAQAAEPSLAAPVDREVALILRDGAWLGLRNAAAVAAAGLAVRALLAISRPGEGGAPLPEAETRSLDGPDWPPDVRSRAGVRGGGRQVDEGR